jgi:hypothetical protein
MRHDLALALAVCLLAIGVAAPAIGIALVPASRLAELSSSASRATCR